MIFLTPHIAPSARAVARRPPIVGGAAAKYNIHDVWRVHPDAIRRRHFLLEYSGNGDSCSGRWRYGWLPALSLKVFRTLRINLLCCLPARPGVRYRTAQNADRNDEERGKRDLLCLSYGKMFNTRRVMASLSRKAATRTLSPHHAGVEGRPADLREGQKVQYELVPDMRGRPSADQLTLIE